MTLASTDILFEPFRLKSLELKNRIVMAPMTRSFSPDGVPGEDVARYYRRRAEGEVGLILSEGTVINRPVSKNDPSIPDFYGEAALAGWKRVIDGVHAVGGKMGPQIWHEGSMPSLVKGWTSPIPAESPSGLAALGQPNGDAMTDEAIADTITAFGQAAADAKRLGFDVIEIHGAHGYLIDQFFWSDTNIRKDTFGGTKLEERSRFAAEVIKAVRKAVGQDFPLILRLSQWKLQDYTARLATTPNAMENWLVPLAKAGVDVFHCSQRRFWEAEFPEIDGEDGLNFAGWAKKLTGAISISVGSVGLTGEVLAAFAGEGSVPTNLDRLVQKMERGDFDLVAVGRALLNDSHWVHKVRTGDIEGLQAFNTTALSTLS